MRLYAFLSNTNIAQWAGIVEYADYISAEGQNPTS